MRGLGLINPTEKAMSSYSISREATGVIVQARENLKLKLETKNQLFGQKYCCIFDQISPVLQETMFGAKNENISSQLTVLRLTNRFICAKILGRFCKKLLFNTPAVFDGGGSSFDLARDLSCNKCRLITQQPNEARDALGTLVWSQVT